MTTPPIAYRHPPGLPGVELLHLTDPDFQFAPHIHDAYVFWFNGDGGERVSLGGTSDILQPDSFGVVAPGEVHANHAVTDHRTLQSLYVDQSALNALCEGEEIASTVFRSRLQRDSKSRLILARLHNTLMQVEDEFLIRESFLRSFGALLARHGERGGYRDLPRDPVKVRRAKQMIRERFSETLELGGLADSCNCTAPHLIRLFKRETGMTPHAYLMEQRLLCAKGMLGASAPIRDIALDAGFTDQSHLTRRFSQRFGLTPARYRRQIRGQ